MTAEGVRRTPRWLLPLTGVWLLALGSAATATASRTDDMTWVVLGGLGALTLTLLGLLLAYWVSAWRGGKATGVPAGRYAKIARSLHAGRPPRDPRERLVAGRLYEQVVATHNAGPPQPWLRRLPLLWAVGAVLCAVDRSWAMAALTGLNAVGCWYFVPGRLMGREARWLGWLEREVHLPGLAESGPGGTPSHHP